MDSERKEEDFRDSPEFKFHFPFFVLGLVGLGLVLVNRLVNLKETVKINKSKSQFQFQFTHQNQIQSGNFRIWTGTIDYGLFVYFESFEQGIVPNDCEFSYDNYSRDSEARFGK